MAEANADAEKFERLNKIQQMLKGSDDSDDDAEGVVEHQHKNSNSHSKKSKKKKKKQKASTNHAAAGDVNHGPAGESESFIPIPTPNRGTYSIVGSEDKDGIHFIYSQFETQYNSTYGTPKANLNHYQENEDDYDYDEDEYDYEEYAHENELEMFGPEDEVEEEATEEEEDDTNSDSEIEFGLRKAIGIDEDDIANYNPDDDPMNGSQFLLRAMQETKSLPKIAVADPEKLRAKLAVTKVSSVVAKKEEQVPKKRRNRKSKCSTSDAGDAEFADTGKPEESTTEMNTSVNAENNELTQETEPRAKVPAIEVDSNSRNDLVTTTTTSTVSSESEESETEEASIPQTETSASAQSAGPEIDYSAMSPTLEWESQILDKFKRLRAKVEHQRQKLEQNPLKGMLVQAVQIPDGTTPADWFRFCFGTRIPYDDQCAKFRKPASKITSGMSVEILCRQYLDSFFLKSEELNSDITRVTIQVNSCSLTDNSDQNQCKEGASGSSVETETLVPYNGYQPLLSIVLHIPQRSLEKLISMNVLWLAENFGQFIHRQQCEWLYSLLVCIQHPLEATVVSDLRDIVRVCKKERRLLAQIMGKQKTDDQQDEYTSTTTAYKDAESIKLYLNTLNLFITLVGNYFGQRDLLEGL